MDLASHADLGKQGTEVSASGPPGNLTLDTAAPLALSSVV